MRETAQKDRILEVAARLFATYGYHGAGMSQLEKEVGLQRGALYHHIGNKEALLFEINRTQLATMVDTVTRIAADQPDEVLRLRAMARAIMLNISEHRLEWIVHYRDLDALTGDRLRIVLDLRARYERFWLDAVRLGIRRGTFRRMDPSVATKGILGMFNYSYLWLHEDGRMKPEKIADLYCDMVLRGIRADSGT